jgi:gamma-glutamylcyclotransferase
LDQEKMNSAEYYFAYGSNMNPERVRLRRMAIKGYMSGTLNGYRLAFNKRSTIIPGAASANIMVSATSRVEGVIYQLENLTTIESMDPFEGYPVRHSRQIVPIETREGVLESWVYTANEDHVQEGLKPAKWYLDHLLAGKEYLSESYHCALTHVVPLANTDKEPAPKAKLNNRG